MIHHDVERSRLEWCMRSAMIGSVVVYVAVLLDGSVTVQVNLLGPAVADRRWAIATPQLPFTLRSAILDTGKGEGEAWWLPLFRPRSKATSVSTSRSKGVRTRSRWST